MLCIFLLRDVFESLKCYLDLWLNSLLDCIHFYVFPLFEKLFYQARQLLNKSRQIAIYRDRWTSFLDRSYRIFDPLKLFGICLDNFSTDSQSIEKNSIWPIAFDSFSIHQGIFAVDKFSKAPRQIYLLRISALQISTNPRSIETRFL